MLDEGRDFGRHLDVDGDGIPFRTYPGTHPTKACTHPRHCDRYARYLRKARLRRQHAAAAGSSRPPRHGPRPLQANAAKPTKRRRDLFRLDRAGDGRGDRHPEARASPTRIRAFRPFQRRFIADHDFVYVVEQNRDAQLRQPIVNENGTIRYGWCRSCTMTARRSSRHRGPSATIRLAR